MEGGVKCPRYGFLKVWKDRLTPKGACKYERRACEAYFNDLTETTFEHYRLLIEEVFYIVKEVEAKLSFRFQGSW